MGSWVIRAKILQPKDGISQVLFDVYSEEDTVDEVGILMEAVGVIRGRNPSDRQPIHQYGEHPVQENFSCDIEPYTILDKTGLEELVDPSIQWMCGHHARNGRGIFLPGRNVEEGSIRVLSEPVPSSEE